MAFTNSSGDFNTKGMQYPIDIKKLDKQGNIVRSYEDVPPGIENLPMGDKVGTVIETPAEYQLGGQKLQEGADASPGLKQFLDNVASRMEEGEKEWLAKGKTFRSPNRYLKQAGGERESLVKEKFPLKILDGFEDFPADFGTSSSLANEILSPNTYQQYRSRHFQAGGTYDQGEMGDIGFYPNPNLPVMPQVEKELSKQHGSDEIASEIMEGNLWEDGTEVTLGSTVSRHFEKNDYKGSHMTKIMDYIGHHESKNDYKSKQISYKTVLNEQGKPEQIQFDGPARGRYQFENCTSCEGITAVNRTARAFSKYDLAMNYDREDGPFANVFNAFRGKLSGQTSAKEIDISTLSDEEQDFIFIFSKLNGPARNDLIKLLTQDDEPTSDQIFDFWLTHHKKTTTLGRDEELNRWNERTSGINDLYSPTEEVE